MKDSNQRFIFDKTDIRGQWVHLDQSFQDVLDIHTYPEVVALLLGEFLAASVLLGSTLKFEGRLIMQVRSSGEVPLLMAEATHDNLIRGIARVNEGLDTEDFDLLFTDGTLAVSVEPKNGERYQSLVPLKGHNLEACLEDYFEQSEQLKTYIKLAVDKQAVSGLLLQQLPKQLVLNEEQRENQWQHISILARTCKSSELLSLSSEDLLGRLYHNEELKLLGSDDIAFQCSCNEERTARALMMVDEAELEEMFKETPTIDMACEFCRQDYHFTRASLVELLQQDSVRH